MPRYRKLHTKIVEDFDFNEMPNDFVRLFWVLLPLALDSAGRLADVPLLVRSKLFPMRADVTAEMVAEAVDWCVCRGLLVRYQVDGRGYFYDPRFAEKQGDTSREAPSEYPPPPTAEEDTAHELVLQESEDDQHNAHDLLMTNSRVSHDLLMTNSCSDADADADTDADADKTTKVSAVPTRRGPDPPSGKSQKAMFAVLADVCCLDVKLQRAKIAKFAQRLLKAGYAPGDIRAWYQRGGWWYREDFRGRNGDPPTLEQLLSTVKRAASENNSRDYAAGVCPRCGASPCRCNGAGGETDLDRAQAAFLRARDLLARHGVDAPFQGARVLGLSGDGQLVRVEPEAARCEWFEKRPQLIERARECGVEVLLDGG